MSFLTPEDIEFLDANYQWKKCTEDEKQGIIIKSYCLPNGYNEKETDLMLIIPHNYPMSQIDMFYFNPGVSRADNASIPALNEEDHFGRRWQRWSRHYKWCPNTDSLVRHVGFVWNKLESESGSKK